MGFQIVELEMDGEDVRIRKVVPYPFPTFGEAKLRVHMRLANTLNTDTAKNVHFGGFAP